VTEVVIDFRVRNVNKKFSYENNHVPAKLSLVVLRRWTVDCHLSHVVTGDSSRPLDDGKSAKPLKTNPVWMADVMTSMSYLDDLSFIVPV
jgi:hypothetical protein